ncbi:MAG: SnoaL-like domain-containing protein [Phycisphaerae bacterium]
MPDIALLESELNAQVVAGDILGAFEKFYDEQVSMQENSDPPCVGKAANREREKQFVASVGQVHALQVLGGAVGADCSYSEWHFDITFKSGQRAAFDQAVARRWRNGKVVNERFYYAKH